MTGLGLMLEYRCLCVLKVAERAFILIHRCSGTGNYCSVENLAVRKSISLNVTHTQNVSRSQARGKNSPHLCVRECHTQPQRCNKLRHNPRLVISPLHIIRSIIRRIIQALLAFIISDLDLQVHLVQKKRLVLPFNLCTFLSSAITFVIKDFDAILNINEDIPRPPLELWKERRRCTLHCTTSTLVLSPRQGVVVVVAVVVFRTDDTAEGLEEVGLETEVGASTRFDEVDKGATRGGQTGLFLEREMEAKKILMIWVIGWITHSYLRFLKSTSL